MTSPVRTEGGGPEFRILGPLEVYADGRPIDPGPGKQRALLAILLIHRREALSTDRLIDELWDERPPATATKAVQVYVSRLRKLLGPDVLITRGGGYALDAGPGRVDVDGFEALAREGREALEAGDVERAAETLRRALAIWRGEPLADFAYESFAQAESRRLEQARLAAIEDRIDADLSLGRHADLIGELETLAAEHPRRERLQSQLILALYRSGRQADALERYSEVRRRFVDELGIEPGAELQRLQAAILAQDPALEAPPRPSLVDRVGTRTRIGNGALLIVGGGLVLLAAAIAAAVISSGGGETPDVQPNSVAVIDPEEGEVVDDIPVGARPGVIAAGEGAVWVGNLDDDSISQIDPAERTVLGTTVPGGRINGMSAGEGGVWVADARRGTVSKIDPRFRKVVDRIRFASEPEFVNLDIPVAAGGGSVWFADGASAIARIDPRAGRVIAKTNVGNSPVGIAIDDEDLWVADDTDNTVSRISAAGAPTVTATIPVGPGAADVAVGEGAVWVAESQSDRVARVDPETGAVTDTIEVGRRPTGIAAGEGGVWVANSVSGTLSRIDPDSREVDLTVELGQSPQDVTISDGVVWATLSANLPASAPSPDPEDETLRVLGDPEVDPAASFGDPQLAYATCAGLYSYPDAPPPAGSTLEPEVAAGPPEVSDDGRTYTFTIRPGYAFSPPSNEPVTAASFQRAIERVLTPEVGSFGAAIVHDIVGAKAYSRDPRGRVAGITTRGDQLVIRLVRPSADFVTRISTPWFCAIPADTPATPPANTVIPSAGPYYVADYVPELRVVVRRNPNYDGPRPAGPAEIVYEMGVPAEEAIARVEDGDADLTRLVGPDHVARLDRLYGAHSEAAAAGAQRVFIVPELATYFLVFNTNKPPFDDPQVRRAVNFAVDRRALAQEPFPDQIARPSDQLLPPGLPGYADAPIYPLGGPDIVRARRLAGQLRASAVLYVCDLPPCLQLGETLRSNLARIGIALEVRSFPIGEMFERIHTPGEPVDLTLYNWLADYPDPKDFINFALTVGPGIARSGLLDGMFAETDFQRRMDEAAALSGDERYRAYADLDHDLTAEGAPVVPYASGTTVSLFSERIGCQVTQPIYGIVLGRLCLRD